MNIQIFLLKFLWFGRNFTVDQVISPGDSIDIDYIIRKHHQEYEK